jgi:phenylpyruvate tautomerase PptA (4-oxalocrotonate tautomerase family)
VPVLEIEIVGEPEGPDRSGLARRLADAAGEALGAGPGSTWVRLRVLDPRDYAENESAEELRPVFVHVLERSVPDDDALAARVAKLTRAVAAACDRDPETVHVRYEPPGAGRQAFGGNLV